MSPIILICGLIFLALLDRIAALPAVRVSLTKSLRPRSRRLHDAARSISALSHLPFPSAFLFPMEIFTLRTGRHDSRSWAMLVGKEAVLTESPSGQRGGGSPRSSDGPSGEDSEAEATSYGGDGPPFPVAPLRTASSYHRDATMGDVSSPPVSYDLPPTTDDGQAAITTVLSPPAAEERERGAAVEDRSAPPTGLYDPPVPPDLYALLAALNTTGYDIRSLPDLEELVTLEEEFRADEEDRAAEQDPSFRTPEPGQSGFRISNSPFYPFPKDDDDVFARKEAEESQLEDILRSAYIADKVDREEWLDLYRRRGIEAVERTSREDRLFLAINQMYFVIQVAFVAALFWWVLTAEKPAALESVTRGARRLMMEQAGAGGAE